MTHPVGDPFGWAPAPEPTKEVRASIEIAAPPEVVFRALADPRELVAWLGDLDAHHPDDSPPDTAPRESAGDGARDEHDVTPPYGYPVGASWLAHVRAPDGSAGTVSGEFLYAVPPRTLRTTWAASWNRFRREEVTFELAPIEVGGTAGTRVTVTHRLHSAMVLRETTTASGRAPSLEQADLWSLWLARLTTYVATTNALARWGIPTGGDLTQAFDALHRRVVAIHQGESA